MVVLGVDDVVDTVVSIERWTDLVGWPSHNRHSHCCTQGLGQTEGGPWPTMPVGTRHGDDVCRTVPRWLASPTPCRRCSTGRAQRRSCLVVGQGLLVFLSTTFRHHRLADILRVRTVVEHAESAARTKHSADLPIHSFSGPSTIWPE